MIHRGFLLLAGGLAATSAQAESAAPPPDPDAALVVTLSAEARLRYESFADPAWGDDADDGYLWLRLIPSAKVEAGAASVFVQPILGYAKGVAGGPGPVDATGIDLLQAHADYSLDLSPGTRLHFGGGRALIGLGSERLIGRRYGPNIPQPFDGATLRLERGAVRLDAVAVDAVDIGPGDFDDRSDGRRRLRTLYFTTPIATGFNADLYWIGYRQRGARLGNAVGTEQRDTFGLRLFGTRGRLGWNWETMIQRGSFAGQRIAAWSQASETTIALSEEGLIRQLRLRANYASGDRAATGERLESFNAMFPKGRYFGELTPLGPRNIVNFNPAIVLQPSRALQVEFNTAVFWRASRTDGIYDLAGREIRSAGTTRARHVGNLVEANVSLELEDGFNVAASVGAFTAGQFVRQSGSSNTIQMFALEATVAF